tara:strand:- start:232 stop:690 length:459 start_codon:yes stop_codon:yes gene_type:complete
MKMQPKPVWDALTSKADLTLRKAQSAMDVAMARKNEAESRLNKLDSLLAEYASKLNLILTRSHHSQEAGNYRQFIIQLQTLRQRAEQELQVFQLEYSNNQRVVIAADKEKLKFQRLADRARTKLHHQRTTVETKEAEAQSMMQFNLNSRLNR